MIPTKPKTPENLCGIFLERYDWLQSAEQSYEKWHVPIHVQMAIMYQESGFMSNAAPPRTYFFGFIPGPRRSNAYGYAQALDSTWEWYKRDSKNFGAKRDRFRDAIDFIGWYGNKTYAMNRISKWDTYHQYLAYHEGHTGFEQKSYRSKLWLMETAKKVAIRARKYYSQLKECRGLRGPYDK